MHIARRIGGLFLSAVLLWGAPYQFNLAFASGTEQEQKGDSPALTIYNQQFAVVRQKPRNFIVGGGFFTRFVHLPISLSWEAFGEGNGVRSLSEMRERIAKYRRVPIGPMENPKIGCILLAKPFFFEEGEWIPVPSDFSLNIVQGKGYDSEDGTTGKTPP